MANDTNGFKRFALFFTCFFGRKSALPPNVYAGFLSAMVGNWIFNPAHADAMPLCENRQLESPPGGVPLKVDPDTGALVCENCSRRHGPQPDEVMRALLDGWCYVMEKTQTEPAIIVAHFLCHRCRPEWECDRCEGYRELCSAHWKPVST